MKKPALLLLIALFCLQTRAADRDGINRGIFEKIASAVSDKTALPVPDLTVQIALSMLDTPYVGGTLEGEKEELRIFLDKTDCILFVETCICMALTFKGLAITQGDTPQTKAPSYELFCDNIRNMRYRGGAVNGYASRLHYTSEWILQAEANGILKEYTKEIGRVRDQHFSFMTSHKDLYPALKDSVEQTGLIKEAENRLEEAGPYFFVPNSRLHELSRQHADSDRQSNFESGAIRSGDIIFIVSGADGLDISHVAIAYELSDGMHFIHASSKAGKVIIEPRTLADYATRGVRLASLHSILFSK